MNPINAHEKISALGKLIGQKIPECPLLTLPSNWESEQWSDDYKAHALSTITDTETGKLVLPFPLFRYCLPSGKRTESNPEPYTDYYGVISASDEIIEQIGGFGFLRPSGAIDRYTFRAQTKRHFIGQNLESSVELLSGGKWVNVGLQSGVSSGHGVIIRPILVLAYFYAWSALQPISIHPPREKQAVKSKEWAKAREYYSVVHRRHAANSKAVASGATIGDNSATLTAHSRRAHYRILRSPRWGTSIGKRLWVRSCWVGPKEWVDAESKQVYRVVS